MKTHTHDRIHLYLIRNIFATLVITVAAFLFSLMAYYQCSFGDAFRRLFVYDIYTTLYMLLLWVWNYMAFEFSKIIYDALEEKLTWKPMVFWIVLAGIFCLLPLSILFQSDFVMMCLLMAGRVFKQCIKADVFKKESKHD